MSGPTPSPLDRCGGWGLMTTQILGLASVLDMRRHLLSALTWGGTSRASPCRHRSKMVFCVFTRVAFCALKVR